MCKTASEFVSYVWRNQQNIVLIFLFLPTDKTDDRVLTALKTIILTKLYPMVLV